MQGLGQFGAGIVALIVTAGFKGALSGAESVGECGGDCGVAVDKMWRTVIGYASHGMQALILMLKSQ
jgi:MFS transporter, PHS family, inorganic phosphate transporter